MGSELLFIMGHGPQVSTSGGYFPTLDPQLHSSPPHFSHTLSLEGRTRQGNEELECERRREEDGDESQDTRRQQDQP